MQKTRDKALAGAGFAFEQDVWPIPARPHKCQDPRLNVLDGRGRAD
jgi:hypothetical protein